MSARPGDLANARIPPPWVTTSSEPPGVASWIASRPSTTRASTSSKPSYPAGWRAESIQPGQPLSISALVRPVHSPALRSRNLSSTTTGPTPNCSAMIAAVSAARSRSLDTMPSTAPIEAAATNAWRRPSSDRDGSACPCQRPIAFHSDCPWRTTTRSVVTMLLPVLSLSSLLRGSTGVLVLARHLAVDLRAGQHDSQQRSVHSIEYRQAVLQLRKRHALRLGDEHDGVDMTGQRGAVADCQQRRGVDDDEIESAGQLVGEGGHASSAEQLTGIRRNRTADEHPQVVGDVLDGELHRITGQVVGQPVAAVDREHPVELRLAQIRIDQHHARARLGQEDGEVRRRGALALAWASAGHLDRAQLAFRRQELDVRPQAAIGLDRWTVRR